MSGVVIVGAGLAGSRCAEALRAGGSEIPITLVGAERAGPYERPALSKEFLAGTRGRDDLFLRPPGTWGDKGIDLRLGSPVEYVDLRRRTVRIRGDELPWSHLVIATGTRARRLPGVEFPNVHRLRTLEDAVALRAAIRPGSRLVVVGAGFVGAEVASTATGLGVHVTIIETETAPLARVAGAEVGRLLARRWRAEGVALHLGTQIVRVEPDLVELADGSRIPYDTLLVAIGTEPASELLATAGGIPTDACGRTAHDRVYACGDVASFEGRRVEHWTSASGQAATVASTILGDPRPYSGTPYFWSDQFGLRLQMVGTTVGWSHVELDGETASFRARYLDSEGATLAVLLCNRAGDVGAARRELAAAA
jgi:3-phenylpropionate/trans-cinnamate dioxygenase ferredoxin reductase component